MNLILPIHGPEIVLLGWSPKTNHCHYVIISTSIVITSASAEYLWPTTLKEPNVSYGLCLFAYLDSFSYVGLQWLFYTSKYSFIFCLFSQVRKPTELKYPTSQVTSALISYSISITIKERKGFFW